MPLGTEARSPAGRGIARRFEARRGVRELGRMEKGLVESHREPVASGRDAIPPDVSRDRPGLPRARRRTMMARAFSMEPGR